MPMAAGTNDTPSTAPGFADTLGGQRGPALSATSDMPVVDLTKPYVAPEDKPQDQPSGEAIDKTGKGKDASDTSTSPDGGAEGEADAQPKDESQAGGEGKDTTSPQQRAAFARERNKRQAAEAKTQALESKVDQLIEVVSKLAPKEQPKENPRPTRESFDSPDKYDQALEAWVAEETRKTAQAEFQTAQAKQQQDSQVQALIDAFNERKSEFEVDHADYEDVVFSEELKISPPMSQAILEAEDGPAIAYYLGQNPEVAERIAKLSPAKAVYEIGKISTKLAQPPPKPKPEPPRPLKAQNNAGPKDPNDMTMDEWAAHKAEQRRAKAAH
jgi:hypothetical protein